jgi:hypothetical protein
MVCLCIDLVVLEDLHRNLLYPVDVGVWPHMLRRFLTDHSDGLSFMKIRIHIAYGTIGVTYIVVMATLLGACRPFNHYWQINPNPGGRYPMTFMNAIITDSSAKTNACPPPRSWYAMLSLYSMY